MLLNPAAYIATSGKTGGAHSHLDNESSYPRGTGANGSTFTLAGQQSQTSIAEDLNHTINIGSHSHTVSATTANTGAGDSFSVVNAYVKLMGWYRIS